MVKQSRPLGESAAKWGSKHPAGAVSNERELVLDDARTHLLAALEAEAGPLAAELQRLARRGLTTGQYVGVIDWVTHLRVSRGLAPRTCANYLFSVGLLLQWLNDRGTSLVDVTPADIETWQQHLYLERHESEDTRRMKLSAVRRFFEWRELQGKGVSPARAVPGPKRPKRLPKIYTPAELSLLLGACDLKTVKGRRDHALLLFVLSTGARRDEVERLNLYNLNLSANVGAARFDGKGAKERDVGFEGPAVKAMQIWLADRDGMDVVDHDAVFLSTGNRRRGRRLRSAGVYGIVLRAHELAGMTITPRRAVHALRATFATAVYDQDKDIRAVQILLGHEDIATTEQYIAVSETQKRIRLKSRFFDNLPPTPRPQP